MKILHIINTLETGGAQSVLVQLLESWKDATDQHMVISLMKRGQFSERIEAIHIPLEHIDMSPGKIQPAKFIQLILSIRKFKPDVVQTWLYHSDLIGSLATRVAGRAIILWGVHHTITGSTSVKSSTWKVLWLLSLFSKFLPSRIICCSQSAYNTHSALGYPEDKMTTISNGVNTDRYRPDPSARILLRNELGLERETQLVGMFARFHPQKDHDTFVNAVKILLKKKPGVHFVLSGQAIDDLNMILHQKLQDAGIQANVHLLGDRKDMPYLNAGVDLVTLSSSHGEALPMTLCEAMACGTPCVATGIGDIPRLVGDSGLVIAPGNPQALADAWQRMLGLSPMEYNLLSLQARRRVLESYDLADMVAGYKLVYHGLKPSI